MNPHIGVRRLFVPLDRYGAGLQGVDAEFGMGLHGLVGLGGAGKSTLLKALAQIRRPSAGLIAYAAGGIRIAPADAKRRLGYAPQELALYESMTLRSYWVYVGGLKWLSRSEAEAEAERVAGRLGLRKRLNQSMSALSIGMQRKAVVGQALLGKPLFVLLDEPFASLDLDSRRELLAILRDYAEKAVVLIASHEVEEMDAQDYRQVLRLEAGRVSRELRRDQGWATTAAEAFRK